MEEKRTAMSLSMRKLALWHSRNFRPLFTHKHLDPIMSTLGFTFLPPAPPSISGGTTWKEYVFAAGGAQGRPRPRLPYPRIDGLHNHTYQAFLEAVNFHLRMHDISTIFHVRGMPMNRGDLHGKWHALEEDELVYVYREGTLDQATHKRYSDSESKSSTGGVYDFDSLAIRDKGGKSQVGQVVPLADIIVSPRGDEEFNPF
ncbi:uncharacterized protein LOC115747475 [Rhodamnia argentea]|uniref:Uncharacterized protein LOC115747475 n=1 Tax=Rhodamnia argentea TaxID=178133 RepID=A0A8B8PZ12_9MYRT|nr:uncharacterized protein LOC115747475 [Rhodamnia argentea]